MRYVGADRSHWLRRDENMIGRDQWAKVLLEDFKREIMAVHELISSNNNSPNHAATSSTSASPTVHVLVCRNISQVLSLGGVVVQ